MSQIPILKRMEDTALHKTLYTDVRRGIINNGRNVETNQMPFSG